MKRYNESVAAHKFDHPMFNYAKQFVEADEIVIAAPFWNFSIPADDHAFGYIKTLADEFWKIPEISYIKADGLDLWGVDPRAEIEKAIAQLQ